METLDGVLVIDKPEGPTSHDIVTVARRALRTRRIGHTGTLDPLATGVLPLVIGQATRLSRFFTGANKGYDAVIRLGVATDTHDRGGRRIGGDEAAAAQVTDENLTAALERFRGTFAQVPPGFSAKKVGGTRAYALARARQDIPVRSVDVTVERLELLGREGARVRIALDVSAGFYVRALAQDLGKLLGCGAHLEQLRRYRSGGFSLDDAVPLEALIADPARAAHRVVPLEQLLPEFPAVVLSETEARRAQHGNTVPLTVRCQAPPDAVWRLFTPGGRLLGLARAGAGALLQPIVVLK